MIDGSHSNAVKWWNVLGILAFFSLEKNLILKKLELDKSNAPILWL